MLVPDKISQDAEFSSRGCICNGVYAPTSLCGTPPPSLGCLCLPLAFRLIWFAPPVMKGFSACAWQVLAWAWAWARVLVLTLGCGCGQGVCGIVVYMYPLILSSPLISLPPSHTSTCSYHTLWWFLPDPAAATKRVYGIASIELASGAYSESKLPNNYYGVWCTPAGGAGGLLLLRSTKTPDGDPLRADTFYVESYNPTTKGIATVAGKYSVKKFKVQFPPPELFIVLVKISATIWL